jgi:ferredoxin
LSDKKRNSMPKLLLILDHDHPSMDRANEEGHISCNADVGHTVLDIAQGEGIAISTFCGGAMDCLACRISVKDDQSVPRLSPCGTKERNLLEKIGADAYERLACQTKILGDATVHLTIRTEPEEIL